MMSQESDLHLKSPSEVEPGETLERVEAVEAVGQVNIVDVTYAVEELNLNQPKRSLTRVCIF
jgi:hypothetical protein